MSRIPLVAFAALAVACSSEAGGSGGSGGGTSSSASSSTKAATSSTSGSTAQSTGTGDDLEAACARRVAPDCGALVSGCWHLTGYSFESRTGVCTVPDVDCSRATPIEYCVFFPPDQARWQQELLKQRQVGTQIEVLHVPAQSYGVLDDWAPCEQAPACPGWEHL
ncbi:MAG: hypothetical protein JNL21_18865 [Myxococcales bacterium]|nr:hypothetical protein [Myxococcales bacterium]